MQQLSYFLQILISQTGSSYLQIIPLILNQFSKKFVHTYKIHSWTIFILCVVFKCQYFCMYSRKTDFSHFTHIFQRTVTHWNIVWLIRFFSICTGDSNYVFSVMFYHFLNIIRRKCLKNEFRGGHLGFLVAILDWKWILFYLVLYIW